MRAISLLVAACLACLAAAGPAAGMPAQAEHSLREASTALGLDASKDGLLDAAKAAWDAGATQRELLALLSSAPGGAREGELAAAYTELKDLLGEGLLERDARKAASRSLEARVRARLAGRAALTPVPTPSRGADAERERRQRQRRDEIRDRSGRRDADRDLAQPTPGTH